MIFGLEPFGLSPFGLSYDPTGDLSVPNPLAGLLTDSSLQRSYLVYALPLNTLTGLREIVKLGDGFASQSNDTLPAPLLSSLPHALFKAGLVAPYASTNAVMANGQIVANALPTQGVISFETNTLRLLHLKSLEWDLATIAIMVGQCEARLSECVTIFNGVTASIADTAAGASSSSGSANPSQCDIPLLDKTYRLTTPIITETYRGSGAALRGDGSTTYAAGTCPCPSGSMTIEAWIRPKTLAATAKDLVGWRNGTLAGRRSLSLISGGLNNTPAAVVRNDAGTSFILSATSAGSFVLSTAIMYHLAFILDAVNLILTLIVDLDNLTQTVYTMPLTGTFLTTLSNLTLLRSPDTSANFADADIDEVRIYPVALTIDQLNANRDIQLPDPSITAAYYKVDEGTVTTLFDSSPGAHNLTVSGTLKWVGSLEGDASLAGQYPPLWEGLHRQVEPVSVDSQNYVYEVSRNPSATIVTVSSVADKGDPVYIIDTSIADIYDWTPVAGHCVISRMGTRTLLRLQTPPQGTLTVTVTTDVTDFAGIIRRLAQQYPVASNRFTNLEIDLVTFAQTSFKYPQIVFTGLRLANANIWDLMQELAKKSGAWLTVLRTGELTVRVLEEPLTPKFFLTENDVAADAVVMVNKTLAVKRTTLNYRPYQTVQQPNNLATSLSPATKADLGKPLRSVSTPVSAAVLAARPSALDLTQDTLYDDPGQVYTEAVRRQALWGVNRATYSLPLSRGLYQYNIGDVVGVTIQAVDGSYVENLLNAILVIVGYTENANTSSITLQCWGLQYKEVLAMGLIADDGTALTTDDGLSLVID